MSDTLRLALDYQRLRSGGFENYQSVNFRLTKDLKGKNDLAALLEESYASSVNHSSGLTVAQLRLRRQRQPSQRRAG